MSNSDVGRTFIFRLEYFGRVYWTVLRLARTESDQENTTTGIKANNWRELQAEAQAAVIAECGTLENVDGIVCPPEIAQRANWATWERVNTEAPAGAEMQTCEP